MRWWIPFAAVGGLIVAVIVVGTILLSVQDVSEYRDLIAEKVSEETGRKLTINGDFDLSISFSPAIIAEDVTFENAAWGSRPEMLKLKRLEAKVALFPMLGGTVKIKRLVLVDGDLLAETDATGRGNWEFEKDHGAGDHTGVADEAAGDDAGNEDRHDEGDDDSAGGLPTIEDVQFENLRLTYLDGQTGEKRSVHVASAVGQGDGDALALNANGAIDDEPFDATVSLGSGSRDVPVAVVANIVGSRLSVDGTIGDRDEMTGLDLAVSAKGGSLAALNRLGGGGLPDIGAYDLSLRLKGGGDAYVIESLAATLGGSDISGSATWRSDGERPKATADLEAGTLDLDKLLPKGESGSSSADAGATGSGGGSDGDAAASAADASGPERIFSDELLPVDALREMDADVKLRAGPVRYGTMTLSDLNLALALAGGRLAVTPLSATLGGGTLSGGITLDASRRTPRLQTDIAMAGVDIAALGIAPEVSEIIEGPFDLTVDLAGAGGTPHAIASNLDGTIALVMESGVVHNEYIDLIAADLITSLIPGGENSDRTRLNCFVARFDVAGGVANAQALLFDTALTTTAGGGTVDLGEEEAELTLKPRPKDPSLLSLAVPIVVYGPLTDLGFTVKKEEAILGVAGALLGSALLGPAGLIVPFVSGGTGDENPCIAALENPQEQQTEPAPVDGGASSPLKGITEEAPVEDIVEDLLGIFD